MSTGHPASRPTDAAAVAGVPPPVPLDYRPPTVRGPRRFSRLAVVSPFVAPVAVVAVTAVAMTGDESRETQQNFAAATLLAGAGMAMAIAARWRIGRRRDLRGEWFANAGLITGGLLVATAALGYLIAGIHLPH
ncbi:MAG TPA: hypothetical protein VF796_27610 [Humisphaera sp.]